MAIGDKEKREEIKKLLDEDTSLSDGVKNRIRSYIDELENGSLAMLLNDIRRITNNN